MPLTLSQARTLIDAAHAHADSNGWKITVAVVDEGGLLIALSRMDGAFPLSAQIAEAKAVGAALWYRGGDELAALRDARPGFFDAVSSMVRRPLIPGEGSAPIRRDDGVVLGGVGVSGVAGADDRACAEAGITAVFAAA
jgi:glc operon protein GlcG